MRKYVIPALVAALVAALVPGLVADAKSKKKHKCTVDVTARLAQTRVISGSPPVNGSDEGAGTVDGKICGKKFHGAVRGVTEYPTTGTFTGKSQSFGPKGSTRSTLSGTGKLNPDGSITVNGSGKFTGGTGQTKGATGKFTFTGGVAKNSHVTVEHVVGTLKY